MLKISCFLTGEDYHILKSSTPMSRKKVHSLATVLLLPVIMWFATGYMLVNMVLDLAASTSLVVASVIAVVIFLIERNIIMASGKGVMAMRVLMGFITALLGSIALDEVIFEHDIDQQMLINKSEMISKRLIMADSLHSHAIRAQSLIVDEKLAAWYQALDEARKEADGTGGSGRIGVSGITRMKQEIAAQLEASYRQSDEELKMMTSRLDSEKALIAAGIEDSFNNHALLLRIKALFDLVITDEFMLAIYLLLTVFLFFIEFAVVLMKASWKKTCYEHKLEAIEIIGRKNINKIVGYSEKNFDAGIADPRFSKTKKTLHRNMTAGIL
jgi:hypothetical protein